MLDVAVPVASVVSVSVAVSLAKVPLAPLAGAVKVTETLGTGLPDESVTKALSVCANAVPTVVDCGVPLVAVTAAGAPARFVSEKSAGVETPAAVAVTV